MSLPQRVLTPMVCAILALGCSDEAPGEKSSDKAPAAAASEAEPSEVQEPKEAPKPKATSKAEKAAAKAAKKKAKRAAAAAEREQNKAEAEALRSATGSLKNPVKLWETSYHELIGEAPEAPTKPKVEAAWPACATGMVRTPLAGEMKRRQSAIDEAYKAPYKAYEKTRAAFDKRAKVIRSAFKEGEPTRVQRWQAFSSRAPALGKSAPIKSFETPEEMRSVRKRFQTLARTDAPVQCKVKDVGTWDTVVPDIKTAAKASDQVPGPIAGYMFVCVGPEDKTNTPFMVAVDAYTAVATLSVADKKATVTKWDYGHDLLFDEVLQNRVFAIAQDTVLEFSGYSTLARVDITRSTGKALGMIDKVWRELFEQTDASITPGPSYSGRSRVMWSMDFRARCAHRGFDCAAEDGREGPSVTLVGEKGCAAELEARAGEMLEAVKKEKPGSEARRRLLQMVKVMMPSDKGVKAIEAEEAQKAKDFATAVDLYIALGDAEALSTLGSKLARGKTLALGVKALKGALSLKAGDPALSLALGSVLAQSEDTSEAIRLLKGVMSGSSDPKLTKKAEGLLKKLGAIEP